MILTSHRKKSGCFFSDTLFTNSLNGRVLCGDKEQVSNPHTDSADLCLCATERKLTCTQSFCEGSPSELPWIHGSSPPCLPLSVRDTLLSTSPHTAPDPHLAARPACAGRSHSVKYSCRCRRESSASSSTSPRQINIPGA